MSKLSYSWFPKDWANDEAVFELLLDERGLFRELIDIAMLNDNTTKINTKVWCRKFAVSEDKLEQILITLENLKLIEINKDTLFIPSCEKRLNLVRAGRIGGQKSKLPAKQEVKQKQKQTEKKVKEDTFEMFWEHYHNVTKKSKESKEPALKHWNKLTLTEQRKAYTSVLAYSKTQEDNKYLVKARTYLSDKRFNDEFETEKIIELDKNGNRKFDFGSNITKV